MLGRLRHFVYLMHSRLCLALIVYYNPRVKIAFTESLAVSARIVSLQSSIALLRQKKVYYDYISLPAGRSLRPCKY
jgi:hypothetical protein